MFSEFEAIAMHVPAAEKIARNLGRRDVPTVRTAPGIDALGCFTEASGARILVAEKGDAVELWPAVRSEATPRPANITLTSPFVALVDVFDQDLALTHRLIAGVEDPFRFDIGTTAGVEQAYFSALALEITAFDSEEDYEGPVPYGADFISAPDLFALADDSLPKELIAPVVTMGVTVTDVETRTNEFNGLSFQLVTLSDNLPMTIAVPESLPIRPGQWLWGTWKLMVSLGSWDQ